MTQALVATLLVGCASVYCIWVLMPRRWRAGLRTWLGLTAPAAAGGCGGCGGACARPAVPVAATAVVHLHRRPKDAAVKAAQG